MSPHAAKHFARQTRRHKSRDIDLGHPLGYPRASNPVQAWARASSRLAYHKAHRRISQNAPIKVVPMD